MGFTEEVAPELITTSGHLLSLPRGLAVTVNDKDGSGLVAKPFYANLFDITESCGLNVISMFGKRKSRHREVNRQLLVTQRKIRIQTHLFQVQALCFPYPFHACFILAISRGKTSYSKTPLHQYFTIYVVCGLPVSAPTLGLPNLWEMGS